MCVDNVVLKFGKRIFVTNVEGLRREILEEAHCSSYAMHPRNTKIYRILKEYYWWQGMKKDIAKYVSQCLTYQQIKDEHKHPVDLLKLLPMPEWKWEHITIDFIVGLPRT